MGLRVIKGYWVPNYLLFDLKKIREILFQRKKSAAKIKDANYKFSDLYKNLYQLSFPSARST